MIKKTKIRLTLKSYDHQLLDKAVKTICLTAKRTGALLVGPIPMPNKKRCFTVLRSPHIDKKSREQFVFKRMQRFVRYAFQNSSDVYAFLFGLKNLECSGVELKISLRSWNYFYKTEK